MAQAIRVSPGVYTVNGKTYRAKDSQTALQMAGAGGGSSSAGGGAAAADGSGPGTLRGQARRDWYNAHGSTNGEASGMTSAPAPALPPTAPTNAGVAQGGNNVADASFDAAMSSLQDPNNQIGTAFNPTLTNRLSDGDLMANRQKVEDAVFGRLTADNAKNKAFDSNSLEQNLYNRGIPFAPDDPQRARWTGALDKRYDDLNMKARQDAISQADAANQQEIAMNEAMRTNDYNIQQGTNQTQMGNFGSLAGTGTATAGGVINNAATQAAMDALKKKTPAEIAALNRSNQRPAGGTASQTQSAFG